jgi:sensor c-di-GMP phosphodiesterase-like protein
VLLAVGCRYGQGFLYAQAMPIDEAIGWQHERRTTVDI